jgi:hypothetical protein
VRAAAARPGGEGSSQRFLKRLSRQPQRGPLDWRVGTLLRRERKLEMLMIGLFNLLLAAGVVAGLVAVCLVTRLFGAELRPVSSAQHPERLAA